MTERPAAPAACAACGEEQVVPILWGMPRPDDDLSRTDVVFGGCIVVDADSQCRSCGQRFSGGRLWSPVGGA